MVRTYIFPKPKYFEVLCLASGLSLPSSVRYPLGSNIPGSMYPAAFIALFLVAQLKESASSFYALGAENDNAPTVQPSKMIHGRSENHTYPSERSIPRRCHLWR